MEKNPSLLIQSLFGVNLENSSIIRKNLFHEIHEIVFHGKNYSWETVYMMPIWLRKYTLSQLLNFYKKQEELSTLPSNPIKNFPKFVPKNFNKKVSYK